MEVSIHCPHCGQYTAVSPAPLGFMTTDRFPRFQALPSTAVLYYLNGGENWWMGKCNACMEPVLVVADGFRILPPPQPGPVDAAIPEPMQSDLREAKKCLAVSASNAAVVMARRALQVAAVQLGAPQGEKLGTQIKWLEEHRKITSEQRSWADAARWVGNHGAHDTEPDVSNGRVVITEVSMADASETVELVEHLFETIYVASQIAQRQLAKRGKSKREG